MKIEAGSVWREYERCRAFNEANGLYDTVERNTRFMSGEQWKNLNAPDLDKPVINVTKRVVNYLVAMLVSDSVAVSITSQGGKKGSEQLCAKLQKEVTRVIENCRLSSILNRDLLRCAAITGDADLYFYYDADTGAIRCDQLENTRYLAGNPYEYDVQAQPYVILARPMLLESAKKYALSLGLSREKAEALRPDRDGDRVTILVRLWKENGSVHSAVTAHELVLRGDTDLEYRLYPVAHMSWERKKDSYHGLAAVTEVIPNQIAINKLWAMALRQMTVAAFPKIFYDADKISRWTNRVGEAIGVAGNPSDAVFSSGRSADMSSQLIPLVQQTIELTKEMMGASDAALGNVPPENTSAIIAVQKATAAPLDLQKLGYRQFVEDYARIIIDMMAHDCATDEFRSVDASQLDIKIEVGDASYWSELLQVNTLDSLYSKGAIDALTYIENTPDGYVRNKPQILCALKNAVSGASAADGNLSGSLKGALI